MRWVAIAACWLGTFSAVANPVSRRQSPYGVEEDASFILYGRTGDGGLGDAMATQVGVDILKQGGNAVGCRRGRGLCAGCHAPRRESGRRGFMLLRTKDGATTHGDDFVKWRRCRDP